MKKDGFTLMELLAVIAILAILMVVILPNVIEVFNKSKKDTFINEVRAIYKVAKQKWVMDPMKLVEDKVYNKCASCSEEVLDLTGRGEMDYFIKINTEGNVVELYVTDRTYQYRYSSGNLKVTDINDAEEISSLSESNIIVITNSGTNSSSNNGGANISEFCVDNSYTPIVNYQFENGMTVSQWFNSSYNPRKPEEFIDFFGFYEKAYYSCSSDCERYVHRIDSIFNNEVPLNNKLIDKSVGCYEDGMFIR